jgi:hypothetical protein
VRDISAHLAEIYGVSVGRDLISRVTDAVMESGKNRGRLAYRRQRGAYSWWFALPAAAVPCSNFV